ncbi:hypothetical protein [Butyricimonas virosa]|uniref:hypothetical protein n=1 Tax=Butyricimonas virosa TaxID=544645 RepID=UPI00242EBD1A|nr:hypothetical protein [Butyricimonas virosa]
MEKLKFISFIVLCLLGINRIAYSQEQDTVIIKDSIAKMKLDKKLIKLAKQVVLKHGPEYYREYREPVIRYRRVSKAWNDLYPEFIEAYAGQVFYTVEYPYNEEEERFYTDYSAKVYFHEDLTIFHVSFGHCMGIKDYDKLSRAEKNKIRIPYIQRRPGKRVRDTIRDDNGNIIEIINRYEEPPE